MNKKNKELNKQKLITISLISVTIGNFIWKYVELPDKFPIVVFGLLLSIFWFLGIKFFIYCKKIIKKLFIAMIIYAVFTIYFLIAYYIDLGKISATIVVILLLISIVSIGIGYTEAIEEMKKEEKRRAKLENKHK